MTHPITSRTFAPLAAAALLLAGALPAAALAAPPSTSIVGAGTAGPSATFTEVAASADCQGTALSGGGTRLAQTTRTVVHNGIHIEGSFPSADGSTLPAGGEQHPTRWVAVGGSGGGVPSDAQTLAYGVCLDAGPSETTVVAASTRGPTGTFQMLHATATCPAGSRLLGGGSRTTPGVVGSLKPNGSFPSEADGTPVLSGANPSSWTVTGLNGGGGDQNNTTYAFALCALDGAAINVTVAHSQVPGPALASTPVETTATCPAGTALLGGGGFVSDAYGLPGSQGDHLTGSYPSDPSGTPVASGSTASWTAASHTGGVDSGALTQTDAWAMCASAGDAPLPAAPPAAAVGKAPPRVSGSPEVGRTLSERHGTWSVAPSGYAYRWLRCSATASTCDEIPRATKRTYRLTLADLGSRIRVQERATTGAGTSAPAVSAASAAVQGGHVTAALIRSRLRGQIVPRGNATKIPALLVRGDTVLGFTGLQAGRAVVTWYLPAQGKRKAVVAARGIRRFVGALATTIDVRLTSAGNRALNATKRIRLTARASFTPAHGRPISVAKTFLVTI